MYAEDSKMGDRIVFRCCELWAATTPKPNDFTNIYMLAEVDVINQIHRDFYVPTEDKPKTVYPS